MHTVFGRAAAVVGVVVVAAGGVMTGGCEKQAAAPVSSSAVRPADFTYTTRGQVEMVPSKDKPGSEFVVHHEPIDGFVNPDGRLGMNSMSMPFPTGSVSLDGIKVGDKVKVTFGVWKKPAAGAAGATGAWTIEAFALMSLEKLPEQTVLTFGKAAPPLAPAPAGTSPGGK